MSDQDSSTTVYFRLVDPVTTGLVGVLITGAITFYGIYSNLKRDEIAQADRRAHVLLETMNHRESSAAQMRAKMFETLMEHYFSGQKDDVGTRRVVLELIALNFQDHLHLRPLFESLDVKLKKDPAEREKLRAAAERVKRREIDRIVGSGGEVYKHEPAAEKEEEGGKLGAAEQTDRRESDRSVGSDGEVSEKELKVGEELEPVPYGIIRLKLLSVGDDHIVMSSGSGRDEKRFRVGYYNMVFSDSVRLGELTYSVLLSRADVGSREAKIRVVVLPKNYYSPRDSLRFDAMIGDLLEKTESAE